MFNISKELKIIIIALLLDLFLFWFLFYSGIVLPFINPSIELFEKSGTSFPRNTNQMILWFCLQLPFILYVFYYILKCFSKHQK